MNLKLGRGVFTRGRPPFHYLKPLGAHLFLSANPDDVKEALAAGFPAARVYDQSLVDADRHADEIRIAFDGDAVLFSDESEKIFQDKGLDEFIDHEQKHAMSPLEAGPFKRFLLALHNLQAAPDADVPMRVRTALVTARSAPHTNAQYVRLCRGMCMWMRQCFWVAWTRAHF